MKMHRSTAFPSFLARCLALLVFAFAGAAMAQQQAVVAPSQGADPPARVGTITALEGSVVFAPAGETDWTEVPRNRPLTRGDRLWTDEGARAEVHFGSAVVHMDSRTFVEVMAVDEDVVQLRVNEGVVNARVREMRGGDNFEIDTPQLALRVTEPGDWRMDVDAQQGFTRVAVRSGSTAVFGANGGAQQITAGRQAAFAGRDLAQLANPPQLADNGFERWALDRNRAEDQSIAARHIPRDVVGYQELDNHGQWSQDPEYGAVWYPQVSVADWAPYRYGRWEWIAPWGWTWIDDAPWGFAPFHYGRWATIGSRWAWVPGPIGRRPVYSPALVAFVGGGSGVSFSFSSGPGIGWYPLAPGEIWQPFYAASPVYVRNVNRYVVVGSRSYNNGPHRFLSRPDAITAMRTDDFNRGRHVPGRWSRVNANDIARVQQVTPPMPSREFRREQREQHVRAAPPPVQRFTPPQQQREQARGIFQPPERRDFSQREVQRERHEAQREQRDTMREQQRAAQQQREQQVRDMQAQRQQQQWREQQQAVQAQRQEAARQQHEMQQRQHQEAQRQQQAAREMQRQQAWQAQQQQVQQQRAWAQQQQQQAPQQREAHPQQQVQRREAQQQRREERSQQRQAQREDEGRGRGRRYE
ncbi:DUF6600 domain-containing protein [Ramlibacter sp. PS4R-6]|uniref:DUF6600 domain-containing protein n=1 Tax=Ramlibacter sp. PS4R-6 TaxID=3133438 RepID=UPI0030B68507